MSANKAVAQHKLKGFGMRHCDPANCVGQMVVKLEVLIEQILKKMSLTAIIYLCNVFL